MSTYNIHFPVKKENFLKIFLHTVYSHYLKVLGTRIIGLRHRRSARYAHTHVRNLRKKHFFLQ